jgi:flagellar biosynthesis protein
LARRFNQPPQGPAREGAKRAVALQYAREHDPSPRVTAKGQGLLALRMIEIAHANGVEVREDRDLIRLLATVDIDSPIPVEAFQAVAEILSYIYRKQGALAGKPETAKPQGNMK